MAALAPDPRRAKRSQIQLGAIGVGAVFVLVGIAGFVPGITSRYMHLQMAGPDSTARLLGIFQVSVLHNVVHLLFGVAGILLSSTPMRAKRYLFWGGVVYAVLFFYGILIPYQGGANFVPFNAADDALHIFLAGAMMTASLVLDRGPTWTQVLEEGKADL
jgi:hypothetical protein